MTRTTRLLVAAGVIVLLLGIVVARRADDPASVAAVPTGGSAVPAGKAAAEPPVADVKLELLKGAREELTRADRDPFRFQQRAAERPAASGPARPRQAPVAVAPRPVDPTPAPPQILLKFIGLLDTPGRPGAVAILSDNRGNVFYGKEGDVVEGRYKVIRIGADSVELSFTDGHGRQTLRLSGQ